MNKAQDAYLEWISKGMLSLHITEYLTGGAFKCSVYKVNEMMNDVLTPVMAISNLSVASYDRDSAALKEFKDFLEFVEKHNSRQVLLLVEVSMHLFWLIDEPANYVTVDAVMDGKNSKITIYKFTG